HPGGEIKMMLYNRHSVHVFNQWVKCGLLRGKPFQSLRSIMWNYIESTGTKGYTCRELAQILSDLPLEHVSVHTEATSADCLSASALPPLNKLYRIILRLGNAGRTWDVADYIERPREGVAISRKAGRHSDRKIRFSGNRFGFFHCISARKSAAASATKLD